MSLGFFGSRKDPGGLLYVLSSTCEPGCLCPHLNNVVSSSILPWDIAWILLRIELDLLAIYDEVVAIDLDLPFELTVHSIILQHVRLARVVSFNSSSRNIQLIPHNVAR